MDTKKWLYFAKQADEANLDGIDDVACFPAANLMSIEPHGTAAVLLKFTPIRDGGAYAEPDTVKLTTVDGDNFEVANEIVRFINSGQPTDGFITIADDTVTQDPGDAVIPAIYAHPSITGVNSINLGIMYDVLAPSISLTGNSPTVAPANNGTLSVNTHYASLAASRAWRVPPAASGRAGDWISMFYTTAIGNGNVHSFTTTTDTLYRMGSRLHVPSGSADARIGVAVSSSSGSNVLTITGATNGDGGVGTTVIFKNLTGETNGWAIEAIVQGQGTTAVASADTIFS